MKSKLELLAELRGISVEDMRKQFSDMGRKSTHRPFKDPAQAKLANLKSQEAKKRKRDARES